MCCPQRSIWRHVDISTCPIPLLEVSECPIPNDLERIRLLLSAVVVRENQASDYIDLEYQLQGIMGTRVRLTAYERTWYVKEV